MKTLYTPSVVNIFKSALNQQSLISQLHFDLLRILRQKVSTEIKNQVLFTIEELVNLEEGYLGLLSDSVPVLAECLEEEDIEVKVRNIIDKIERISGESLA